VSSPFSILAVQKVARASSILFLAAACWLCGCVGDGSGWSLVASNDAWIIENGTAELELTGTPFRMTMSMGDKTLFSTSDKDGIFAAAAVVTTDLDGRNPAYQVVQALKYAGPVDGFDGPSASFSMMNGTTRLGVLNVTQSGSDGFRIEMAPDFAAFDVPVASWGFSFDIDSMGFIYGQGILTAQKNYREQHFFEGVQHFPMNSGSFSRPLFVTDEGTNIVSPLWFTSKGLGMFIDSYSTLSLDFNLVSGTEPTPNGVFRIHVVPLEGERTLAFDMFGARTTVQAYREWVNRTWVNRPDLPVGSRPADELFTRPIWTTWAAYKWDIDQERILNFAHSIIDHGYDAGVIEIDDKWTRNWGDLRFDQTKFPTPVAMIDEIHGLGADVTAWIPPFVNNDAEDYDDGVKAGAFVSSGPDTPYPALVGWWDILFVPFAGTIDFTSPAGRDWWGARVQALMDDYGLDGFKYDAGETCFLPKPIELAPGVPFNSYPDHYADWGFEHAAAEMRSGWFSQHQPVLFRLFDKNSEWGLQNGMSSVVTQFLALGMIGYPFIMPDMLGGNEYLQTKCDDELMIRWAQMNALLPCIQYSILPWRDSFAPSTNEIVKRFHDLRAGMADEFLRLADEAAATQMPIVRPMFFEFPDDPETYPIGDQFMLGDRYLVAPVLEKGATSRNVYLPAGTWAALDDQSEVHVGPIWLNGYPAPIDRLPAFVLQH